MRFLQCILRFTARRLVILCMGLDLVLDVYAKRATISCILLLYIHIYLMAKILQSPRG
jgi:predicted ABC-type exoprotein transport system permease subunit